MFQGQRSADFSIIGPILRIKAEKLTEKELRHKNYMFHGQWLIVLKIYVTLCESQWRGIVSRFKNGRCINEKC